MRPLRLRLKMIRIRKGIMGRAAVRGPFNMQKKGKERKAQSRQGLKIKGRQKRRKI